MLKKSGPFSSDHSKKGILKNFSYRALLICTFLIQQLTTNPDVYQLIANAAKTLFLKINMKYT